MPKLNNEIKEPSAKYAGYRIGSQTIAIGIDNNNKVTSRDEHLIDRVTKTTLRPIRIEGNHIASFMEAYLTRLNKRELFTDSEFFVACSRLSKIIKPAKGAGNDAR